MPIHKTAADPLTAEQAQEMVENMRRAVGADTVVGILGFNTDDGTSYMKTMATREPMLQTDQVAEMIEILLKACAGIGAHVNLEFAMRYPGGEWLIERGPEPDQRMKVDVGEDRG